MADSGIQMSEAFSHFLFVPSLSKRVHEGPSESICDTQSMEHYNKCFSYQNKKLKSRKQPQKLN